MFSRKPNMHTLRIPRVLRRAPRRTHTRRRPSPAAAAILAPELLRRSGWWRRAGGGGPRREAEELEHELLVDGRDVADALAEEALQHRAVAVDYARPNQRRRARIVPRRRHAHHVDAVRVAAASAHLREKGGGGEGAKRQEDQDIRRHAGNEMSSGWNGVAVDTPFIIVDKAMTISQPHQPRAQAKLIP
ncbi:hypothetical protein S40285_10347 [Stachybotrys chlorohalonatus IBT 40285]|uniref:Uncharacterized protein n=1 Tax=Stachybotrys chlorohalonatus (strain IBT 40285) TaxID=1283841 RepID=A0A084QGM8_STAC4|nr:hypothetical protein S40285_10347 [Stachybotrys chlorohalonata IBT 40285]